MSRSSVQSAVNHCDISALDNWVLILESPPRNMHILPVHNWQVSPCQTSLARRFIPPLYQPHNQRQEVLVVFCAPMMCNMPGYLLIVTHHCCFLCRLSREHVWLLKSTDTAWTGGIGRYCTEKTLLIGVGENINSIQCIAGLPPIQYWFINLLNLIHYPAQQRCGGNKWGYSSSHVSERWPVLLSSMRSYCQQSYGSLLD